MMVCTLLCQTATFDCENRGSFESIKQSLHRKFEFTHLSSKQLN